MLGAGGGVLAPTSQGETGHAGTEAVDEEVFRDLVHSHARLMFRVAFRMTRNQEDAEDVVQEAMLKAYKGLATFEARSQTSTWLHRITTNCAIDLLRKRKRLKEDAIPDETEGPAPNALVSKPLSVHEQAFQGDLGRGVSHALAQMSPVERAAFVLRHYEGRSLAEIGEQLELSLAATKQAIFRAVRKARAVLEPLVQV